MILPDINLSFLDSITSVPLDFHSTIIHFVIVLPIVLLLLEMSNIAFKRKSIDLINIAIISLLFVSLLGAYLTGMIDSQNALLLGNRDMSNAITEHKVIGVYMFLFGISFIVIFKIIAFFANKILYSILYILMIILFIFVSFIESKSGADLVDKYGINVLKVTELQKIQIDMNQTIIKQNVKILEMNKTIQDMKLKELNATQTINMLTDMNSTKELNSSSKVQTNTTILNQIKSIFQ
jgi:uncharacterized membrane protein